MFPAIFLGSSVKTCRSSALPNFHPATGYLTQFPMAAPNRIASSVLESFPRHIPHWKNPLIFLAH